MVQFLVASRAEAGEAGLDKLDPWSGSHFLTKSPRNCIIANPPTFNRRCCRIRDVVQFLVASRAEATEAGLDKLDPRTGSHFLTKSPRYGMTANPPTVSPSTSPK